MLSVDDFVTQVQIGSRIKCRNVTERIECIEILDDVGFDAGRLYEILKYDIFSEIPKDTASNNEEFCEAINELLFA